MATNLSRMVKTNCAMGVLTSTAATAYGDKIDMAGYEGCRFVGIFKSTAASTGTAVFTIIGTDTSTAASTSYTALNGASITVPKSTTAKTERFVVMDVYRPQYRYLKAKLVQTAKIWPSGIIADQYGTRYQPTSPSSSNIATSTVALGNVLTIEST